MQSISLLGSTGSIGVNALDVIRRNPTKFRIEYLTTNRRIDLLREQIEEFRPRSVVVMQPEAAERLRREGCPVPVLSGEDALVEAASNDKVDTVIGALVGFSGLRSTAAAAEAGKRICLANKETLVVAGELITSIVRRTGAKLLPIDSEHSAILQCLTGEAPDSIRRIILTASGGPFRQRPHATFSEITLEEALKHPNWDMGSKITIDSATMMNKGLEIIEAQWLFDVPMSKIDVVVHPQSIVHSLVEFVDGSVMAQLGAPDMRLPIQYALSWPERIEVSYDSLDLIRSSTLTFEEPDTERFPALRLARMAGERGGLFPCVLNAANEVAVEAFLNRQIGFMDIPQIIEDVLLSEPDSSGSAQTSDEPDVVLEALLAKDKEIRAATGLRIQELLHAEQ